MRRDFLLTITLCTHKGESLHNARRMPQAFIPSNAVHLSYNFRRTTLSNQITRASTQYSVTLTHLKKRFKSYLRNYLARKRRTTFCTFPRATHPILSLRMFSHPKSPYPSSPTPPNFFLRPLCVRFILSTPTTRSSISGITTSLGGKVKLQ